MSTPTTCCGSKGSMRHGGDLSKHPHHLQGEVSEKTAVPVLTQALVSAPPRVRVTVGTQAAGRPARERACRQPQKLQAGPSARWVGGCRRRRTWGRVFRLVQCWASFMVLGKVETHSFTKNSVFGLSFKNCYFFIEENFT